LVGTEGVARARILKYCQRRKLEPTVLLSEFEHAPRIKPAELPEFRQQLILATELAVRVLDSQGLPLERYRTEMGAQFMHSHKDLPPLVQAAMRYVHRQYSEALQITGIAEYLKCHPDYLSRLFKKEVKVGLGEYILRVRIDRARHLIETRRFSLGEIGWNVGFQDQSHFGRVFKRLIGVAPGKYLETSGSGRDTRSEPGPEGIASHEPVHNPRVNPDLSRIRAI